MGFKISRQRYFDDNRLAVEICVGSKHVGKDILTTRYQDIGESKYLVSPIDAYNTSIKLVQKWNNDYYDELKSIALVNSEGKGERIYLDPSSKNDLAKLETWANKTLKNMAKCGHCSRVIGATTPIHEDEKIPNKVYCCDLCLGTAYRNIFGEEIAITQAKKIKLKK